MATLDAYAALVAVIDAGNLTAAARQLGRTVQAVSTALKGLERQLGQVLVVRTTRRCIPTEAGLRFAARLRPVLAELADASAEAADDAARLSGPIRLGASTVYGPDIVLPILSGFLGRHPEIAIELVLSDQHVDLAAAKLDLAIRIGPLRDDGLRARKLGTSRRVIVGAPSYLARHGRPATPDQLAQHECILREHAGGKEAWIFESGEVTVSGRFSSGGATARYRAAALGLGLCLAPLWQVGPLIDAGQLERVLTDHPLSSLPIHIVWPSGRTPRRVRALVDLLAAHLSLAGQ